MEGFCETLGLALIELTADLSSTSWQAPQNLPNGNTTRLTVNNAALRERLKEKQEKGIKQAKTIDYSTSSLNKTPVQELSGGRGTPGEFCLNLSRFDG